MEIRALQAKATQIRMDLLQMIAGAQTGHTGGSLSNTDILTALYYRVMNIDPAKPKAVDRDRFILSKGHSVESLWSILADRGFSRKMSWRLSANSARSSSGIRTIRCQALR